VAGAPGGDARGAAARGPRFTGGLTASLALAPSVFVYGTVFGGLAVQSGLWPLEVLAMSLLVLAGASQFVAVPMIATGAPAAAVIVTTYVVNMRHYLMAATLAPAFRGFPRLGLAAVAHLVNDESFAVAVARRNPPDPWFYVGSAVAICAAFVGGVAVGLGVGGLVEDPRRYGLDFAFPAVFLALAASQLRRRPDWAVAVSSAVVAVALSLVLPGNWHIVVAGLAVSLVGALALRPEPA
jgi:4-azaleucine resistance transporter AzlC